MALVTKGKTFANGELVTPAKIHQLVDSATVTNIDTADISNSAITTAKIADSNVTTAKIQDSAITSAKIADANVTTAKIADSAITSAKIADGTIVNADISNTAGIALSKLATGSLPTGITVASENIVDGTIVNADISSTADIADTKLATISTAGKIANTATTAASANTANAIVTRDASGNFSAGTISANLTGNVTGSVTGNVTGNASTATTLQTARNINGVSFNGSADITITANPNSHNHDASAITSGTLANARTTATSANTANAIVTRDASGNFSAGTISANLTGNVTGSVTGNASTATTLQTARTIDLSTDASGSVSFNGSTNVTIPVTIANNAVTTAKIADANVTTAKIADANVTTAKIANGAITQEKLNSSVTLVPTGAVMPFAMNSAPTGWLAANGDAVSRATYAALFSAIGTTYGAGDGGSTFNLPDLRGYFVRGFGTNGSDGTASAALGAKQADAFQGHFHQASGQASNIANGMSGYIGTSTSAATSNDRVTSAITDGTNGTPRTASETRPRNIAMLYCIKF